jgi:hypothetical protein
MKKILIISLFLLNPFIIEALDDSIEQAYRTIVDFNMEDILVPTPVRVELDYPELREGVLVYDVIQNKEIPSVLNYNYTTSEIEIDSIKNERGLGLSNIADGNYSTFDEFQISDEGLTTTGLLVNYSEQIRTEELSVYLDRYVALPSRVSIYTQDSAGNREVVVNNLKVSSHKINFPEVYSESFYVEFTYSQPLRISEIKFNDLNRIVNNEKKVVFLAQPDAEYIIYANPDRYITRTIEEAPNFNLSENFIDIFETNYRNNPDFVPSDFDNDDIEDSVDNCVRISNPDQIDIDQNGRGDVCDDYDLDGVINSLDNCINEPNRNQKDTDGDGLGDICDNEESRITEKYPELVWGGLIFALFIFGALYMVAIRNIKKDREVLNEEINNNE